MEKRNSLYKGTDSVGKGTHFTEGLTLCGGRNSLYIGTDSVGEKELTLQRD